MSAGNKQYGVTPQRNDERFPDPFADMASLAMPDTIQDALRWTEYLLLANGPYRSALARIVAYFITDIEVFANGDGDDDERLGREEKKKYEDFLNDTLGIKQVLADVLLDRLCYGSSFTSMLVPFRRYLACPGCGAEYPLKRAMNSDQFQFSWSNFTFNAKCPRCHTAGKFKHIDRRSGETENLKIKRWSPHEMDILHDPFSEDSAYIWRIPDDYRALIRKGHLFHLERASWEIIEAIKYNEHLMFDPGVIYHMKETTLAGVRSRGWGVSRVLTNFRQAWYVQVLQRYNEAIALDYIVPFRVITPEPRNGQGGEVNDPVLTMNMGSFRSRVQSMLAQRRSDPSTWHVLPFPIQYQALGGDAAELAPKDLIELGMTTLLDAIGIPVELYKGTMTAQAAVSQLRIFEANWAGLVHDMNRFLSKLVDNVAQLMSWEPVNCRMKRITHADDMSKSMASLQLMMGGQISRTTGLATQDLDFATETRLKLEEARVEAEQQAAMQKEMEQAQSMDDLTAQGGDAAAAGGMPPQPGAAPGMPQQGAPQGDPSQAGQPTAPQAFAAAQPMIPNKPTTPEEMQQNATIIAQQIMAMPESQKDSTLIRLKKSDPTMHALVSSQIDDFRRQMQVQGGAMLMQQQQQQMGKQGSLLYHTTRQLRDILLGDHTK